MSFIRIIMLPAGCEAARWACGRQPAPHQEGGRLPAPGGTDRGHLLSHPGQADHIQRPVRPACIQRCISEGDLWDAGSMLRILAFP